MSDPNDTCPTCRRAFTDTDEEPGVLCSDCQLWVHAECELRHACPKRRRADTEKLRAWEKACADA